MSSNSLLPCLRLLSGALMFAALGAATAQGPAAPVPIPDPLDPQATVPGLNHRSALEAYRRLGEDQPMSWIKANETVNRIGGWRVYAREATQPEVQPSGVAQPPSANPREQSGPHGGPHRH